jgi:hypothetical protein
MQGLTHSWQSINYEPRNECAWGGGEYSCIILSLCTKCRWLAGFSPRRPGFEPESDDVGFLVDKITLGQVFSDYFRFLCHSFLRIVADSVSRHPRRNGGEYLGNGLVASGYYFFQVAPQFYSRVLAEPVPDPRILRKSGSVGNLAQTSGSVARKSDH